MWLDPAAAVGSATAAPTGAPVTWRSSMNAALAALDSAAAPVPTRTTRKVTVLHAPLPSQAFEVSGAVEQIVPAG